MKKSWLVAILVFLILVFIVIVLNILSFFIYSESASLASGKTISVTVNAVSSSSSSAACSVQLFGDINFEGGMWSYFYKITGDSVPVQNCVLRSNVEGYSSWFPWGYGQTTSFCDVSPNPTLSGNNIVFSSTNGYKTLTSYKNGTIRMIYDTSKEQNQGCLSKNHNLFVLTHDLSGYDLEFEDFESIVYSADYKLNS